MICNKCGIREATTYIRTTINGNMTEEHLCSECASLNTIEHESLLSGLFDNFFDNAFGFGKIPSLCSVGGSRGVSIIDQANNSIRMGANKLRDSLKNNPDALRLINLKRELALVVEEENYERASEIKKEIDRLEKGENNV